MKPKEMCFGLSEKLDRESLLCFLKQISRDEFAQELATRISTEELEEFVVSFTALMKKHFSENEYHSLFLQDQSRSSRKGVIT